MQGHQHWVVSGGRAGQEEKEADGAPHTKHDEDDWDEGELSVRNGRQRVRYGVAGQDGTVLGQSCVCSVNVYLNEDVQDRQRDIGNELPDLPGEQHP